LLGVSKLTRLAAAGGGCLLGVLAFGPFGEGLLAELFALFFAHVVIAAGALLGEGVAARGVDAAAAGAQGCQPEQGDRGEFQDGST